MDAVICINAKPQFQINRESIDVCKNYFRDDFTKSDWQLVIQLKKMLEIL